MTSSPTTPPSALFVLLHPPLPDFFPCLSKDFRRWPEPFPTLSEVGSWLRKIWSQGSHDVRLMRLSIFYTFCFSFSRRTLFNNQSEASIFRRSFRSCSRPIRSQEICDVIFGKSGRKGPTVLLILFQGLLEAVRRKFPRFSCQCFPL